jgi:hypothetical protein
MIYLYPNIQQCFTFRCHCRDNVISKITLPKRNTNDNATSSQNTAGYEAPPTPLT